MPLRKVRVILETKPVQREPVKDGPFKGCPQTKCTEFVRRIELDLSKYYGFKTPIKLYGVKYEVVGLGGWRGNRRNYEISARIEDDQIPAFLAKAKAAGERWKRRPGGRIDARGMFMQIPL